MDTNTSTPSPDAAPSSGRIFLTPLRILLLVACLAAAGLLITRVYKDTRGRPEAERHVWTTTELQSLSGKSEADVEKQMGDKYEIKFTSSRYCGMAYLWHYEHVTTKVDDNWVDDDTIVDVVFCDRTVYEVRLGHGY